MCIKERKLVQLRKMIYASTALVLLAVVKSNDRLVSLNQHHAALSAFPMHSQNASIREHSGLLAFERYVEEKLGDKIWGPDISMNFRVQPRKAIELTWRDIDFIVAGTSESGRPLCRDVYEIFSMPYPFDSEEVYKPVRCRYGTYGNVWVSTDEASVSRSSNLVQMENRISLENPWYDAGGFKGQKDPHSRVPPV